MGQSSGSLWAEIQAAAPIANVDPLLAVSLVAVAHYTELCGHRLTDRAASSISVTLQHNAWDQAWRCFMDRVGRVVSIVMG
ncbi:hypothetical protein MANAM107_25560 [Actinomyces capricornis]|uniref:Uncharacterized protein n=1 Tax=Actinomyces capricornis TaxID=2755559 RepID=A0ABM7UEW6_9ACTO|nr:hypothetical protein MANAM107_25560 [Actinomyces capricornis]